MSQDYEYYRSRAAEERTRAAAAPTQAIAAIHLELAERYETLAVQDMRQPPISTGWEDMSAA